MTQDSRMPDEEIRKTDEEQDSNSPSYVPIEESRVGSHEPTDVGDSLFEHHRLYADEGQKPIRIDVFIATLVRNVTRSRVKNAALAGCLMVNNNLVKASYKVKPGDRISFLSPYPKPPKLTAEDVPLEIFYEDDNLLLVNKKPGMVVHPGMGNWTGTMVHGLLWHLNKGPTTDKEDHEIKQANLVHRIDKDTSGLLVVSKDEESFYFLSRQFYDHSTDRNYYAMVWGDLKEDKGTITGHVGRSIRDRKKFMVYPAGDRGKHAVTHYEVLERFGFATLVRCTLETGRTHQIRVHMKYLGHTLFGDYFYGGDKIMVGPKNQRYQHFMKECLEAMPRQALHAKNLGFVHPKTGERVLFDSELPEDFRELIRKFREFTAETKK